MSKQNRAGIRLAANDPEYRQFHLYLRRIRKLCNRIASWPRSNDERAREFPIAGAVNAALISAVRLGEVSAERICNEESVALMALLVNRMRPTEMGAAHKAEVYLLGPRRSARS